MLRLRFFFLHFLVFKNISVLSLSYSAQAHTLPPTLQHPNLFFFCLFVCLPSAHHLHFILSPLTRAHPAPFSLLSLLFLPLHCAPFLLPISPLLLLLPLPSTFVPNLLIPFLFTNSISFSTYHLPPPVLLAHGQCTLRSCTATSRGLPLHTPSSHTSQITRCHTIRVLVNSFLNITTFHHSTCLSHSSLFLRHPFQFLTTNPHFLSKLPLLLIHSLSSPKSSSHLPALHERTAHGQVG